jgi:pimeloyl-ACP methyl ester carboxylesterase
MPSFLNTLFRWNSTVETVTNSREAISAFVLPPAASIATCRSCGVRSLGAGTVRLRTCSPVASSSARHASTKVDTRNSSRGPLLLISGGKDHTVPESVVRATVAQYRHSEAVTDLIDFPDRGHSLTIDSGWPEVARTALDWLRRQSL